VSSLRSKGAACVLAWLAAILIPAALLAGIGLPWSQRVAELDAEIAERDDQIRRFSRQLASLPSLRAELDKERSNEDFKSFYYDAETPALAGAELQRELQDMVRAAGARLINTQFLPAGADEQPPRVRIRAQLQGTTESLLEVVYSIEQARPFLFVDQLSVRASAPRVARPNPRVRGRRAPVRKVEPQGQLTVRLDVFGYALGGGQ
jgi:general secretion pathway protein M